MAPSKIRRIWEQLHPLQCHREAAQSLRHTVVSNDPSPKEKAMTNLDDLHSMFQLLQLLEREVDKQIDDSRYA